MGVWSDRWWKIEFQNNHTTTSSSSCTLWHPSPIPSLLCRVLLCCAISNSRIVYNSWEKNDNHVPMEWSWRQDQTKELSVVDHTHTHTHTHTTYRSRWWCVHKPNEHCGGCKPSTRIYYDGIGSNLIVDTRKNIPPTHKLFILLFYRETSFVFTSFGREMVLCNEQKKTNKNVTSKRW